MPRERGSRERSRPMAGPALRCVSDRRLRQGGEERPGVSGPQAGAGRVPLPPALSRLVGQDYERLLPYLDLLQPMLYRLGEGVACLNYELAALAEEVSRLSGAPLGECLELAYRLAGVLRSALS